MYPVSESIYSLRKLYTPLKNEGHVQNVENGTDNDDWQPAMVHQPDPSRRWLWLSVFLAVLNVIQLLHPLKPYFLSRGHTGDTFHQGFSTDFGENKLSITVPCKTHIDVLQQRMHVKQSSLNSASLPAGSATTRPKKMSIESWIRTNLSSSDGQTRQWMLLGMSFCTASMSP